MGTLSDRKTNVSYRSLRSLLIGLCRIISVGWVASRFAFFLCSVEFPFVAIFGYAEIREEHLPDTLSPDDRRNDAGGPPKNSCTHQHALRVHHTMR